jgi:hypothetical protein
MIGCVDHWLLSWYSRFGNVIVIDNLPIVAFEKFHKLERVIKVTRFRV